MADVHLTCAYRYARPMRDAEGLKIPSVPLTACGAEGEQVPIYPGEDRISCPACLEWLNEEDNRLFLLDVSEWIRRNAGTRDIRYTDIPGDN